MKYTNEVFENRDAVTGGGREWVSPRTTSILIDCALISTVYTRRVTSRVHEKFFYN